MTYPKPECRHHVARDECPWCRSVASAAVQRRKSTNVFSGVAGDLHNVGLLHPRRNSLDNRLTQHFSLFMEALLGSVKRRRGGLKLLHRLLLVHRNMMSRHSVATPRMPRHDATLQCHTTWRTVCP